MADATTQTRTLAPDDKAPPTEKKTFLGLSLAQILGSALAAVTSAVAASFLGVAGTLIGAAMGSVVSTVAGAAYATSLRTAGGRLRTTALVVRPGAGGASGAAQDDPARIPQGFGADPVPVARVQAEPVTHGSATSDRAGWSALARRVRWRPVALVAALGFVLGVGLLSVTEGLLGHPVSDANQSGTTLGTVVGGTTPNTPTPSTTPSGPAATPTDSGTATQTDSSDGQTQTPDATATPDGGTSTSDPATGTPEPSQTAPTAPTDGGATSDPAAAGQVPATP